jgi:hypothetical protein
VGIVIRNKISLQNFSPICLSDIGIIKIHDDQLPSRLTTNGVLLLDRPFIDLIGMEMMSMSMTIVLAVLVVHPLSLSMTIVLAALVVDHSLSMSITIVLASLVLFLPMITS